MADLPQFDLHSLRRMVTMGHLGAKAKARRMRVDESNIIHRAVSRVESAVQVITDVKQVVEPSVWYTIGDNRRYVPVTRDNDKTAQRLAASGRYKLVRPANPARIAKKHTKNVPAARFRVKLLSSTDVAGNLFGACKLVYVEGGMPELPVLAPTEENLQAFAAHLLRPGDLFRFEGIHKPFPVFEGKMGAAYHRRLYGPKGSGFFLEWHHFPHATSVSADARGPLVLARFKRLADGGLLLEAAGFEVSLLPPNHAIFTPGNVRGQSCGVMHFDGALQGTELWMTYDLPADPRDAETFAFRQPAGDSSKILLDEEGHPVKPQPKFTPSVVEGVAGGRWRPIDGREKTIELVDHTPVFI